MAVTNIQMKRLEDLTMYENNPRKNDLAVDKVAKSIEEFGFKVPLVIDRNGVIVCGHTRYKALQQLGWTEPVPCVIADDLTDEQVRAFRLVDNKTGEIADWDMNALALELENTDLEWAGFDMPSFDENEFGTDFTLPEDEQSEIRTMTFTVHASQKELIERCIEQVYEDEAVNETFGNTNHNGNGLYEVVRQWAELRKLS